MKITSIITASMLVALGTAHAATTFLATPGLSIEDGNNWSNGLPGSTNSATINNSGTMTGADHAFLVNDTTYSMTDGTLISVGGSNATNHFLMNETGIVFNMSGGIINGRYIRFDSNNSATASSFNLSGGLLTTENVYAGSGTWSSGGISVDGNAALNISGSGSLHSPNLSIDNDAGNGGSIDFSSGWTGSWTATGFTSAADWKTAFVGKNTAEGGFVTYNGVAIADDAEFDSLFTVSANGQVLTAVPEPSSAVLLGLTGLGFLIRRRR